MNEQELKRCCELSGIKYYPLLTRWYQKYKRKLGDWLYNTHHIVVGYLLYGMFKLKLTSFDTFERWCFCRKPRK